MHVLVVYLEHIKNEFLSRKGEKVSVTYEGNNVVIDREAAKDSVVYLRPNDLVKFNFDVEDATSISFANGDIIITFPDGGRLTLAHYADIQLSESGKVQISDNSKTFSREEFEALVGSKVSSTTNDSNFLVLFRDQSSTKVNEDGEEYGTASEILDDDASEARPAGQGDTEGPEELDTLVSIASQFELKTLNYYTELEADIPIRYTTIYNNKDKDDDVGTEITPVLSISPTVALLYGSRTDFEDNELLIHNGGGTSGNPTLMYNPAVIDYSGQGNDMVVRLTEYNTIKRTFNVDFNNRIVVLQEMTITGIPDTITLSAASDSSFTLDKVAAETYVLKPIGAITGDVSFNIEYPYMVESTVFEIDVTIVGFNSLTETLYHGNSSATIDIHPITGPSGLSRQSDIYYNASSLTDPVHVLTGSGNDTVYGQDYRPGTFETSGGDDTFYGSKADETVLLGGGDDFYYLSEGVDYADGGSENNTIIIEDLFAAEHEIGMQFNKNIIYIIDNNPTKNSTTTVNFTEYTLTTGDDTIEVIDTNMPPGFDASVVTVDALEGNDRVVFTNSGVIDAIGLDLYVSAMGGSLINVLNINTFYGSDYDDAYQASDNSEVIFYGEGGNDAADYRNLTSAIVYNQDGRAEVVKSSGAEDIIVVDVIYGTGYDDTFYVNFTSDLGTDVVLDGSGGDDTVSYIQATEGIIFDLSQSTSIGVTTSSGSRSDVLNNFENVIASTFNDTFLFFDTTADGYTYQAEDGLDTANYSEVGKIVYTQDNTSGVVTVRRYGASGNLAGIDTLVSFESIVGTNNDDTFNLGDVMPSDIDTTAISIDGGSGLNDVVKFDTTGNAIEAYYKAHPTASGQFYTEITFVGSSAAYNLFNINATTLTTENDKLYIASGNSANKVEVSYVIDGGEGNDIIEVTYDSAIFEATDDLINSKLVSFEEVHFTGTGNNRVLTYGYEFQSGTFSYIDKSSSDVDIFDASNIISPGQFTLVDTFTNELNIISSTGGTAVLENFEHIIGTAGSDVFEVNFLDADIAVTYNGATGNDQISYAAATEDITFNLGGAGGSMYVDTDSRTSRDTLKNFTSIVSGSGDDVFLLNSADPYGISIDGGDGIDYISFQNFVLGQSIDLNLLGSLANIEGVVGSNGSDTISTLTDGDFLVDGADGIDSIKYAANDYVELVYDSTGVEISKHNGGSVTGTDTIQSIELLELTGGDDTMIVRQFQNTEYDNNTFIVHMGDGDDVITYEGSGVSLDFDKQDASGNYYTLVSKDYNSATDTYSSFDYIYNNETFNLSAAHQDKVYLSASYFTTGTTNIVLNAGGNSSATSYKDADLLSFSRSSNSQVIDLTSGGTLTIGGITYQTLGFSAFEGSSSSDVINISDASSISGDYYINGYIGTDLFNGNNLTTAIELDLSQDNAYTLGSDISQDTVNKMQIGTVAALYIHDIEQFNLTSAGNANLTLGQYVGYSVNLNTASDNTVVYDYDDSMSIYLNMNTDIAESQTTSGFNTVAGANSIIINNSKQDAITISGDYSSATSNTNSYKLIDTGDERDSLLLNGLTNTGGLVFTGNSSGVFSVETSGGASIIDELRNVQNFTSTALNDTFYLADASVTNSYIIDGDAGTDTIDYSGYSTGLRFALSENRVLDKTTGDAVLTYVNIERIMGTTGDDSFIIGSSSTLTYIDAGDGIDSIDFSLSANALSVDIGASVGTVTILNTESIRGTLYDDTFTVTSTTITASSTSDIHVEGNIGQDTVDLSFFKSSGGYQDVVVTMDTSDGATKGTVSAGVLSGAMTTNIFTFAEMEVFTFDGSVNASVEFSSTSYTNAYLFNVAAGGSLTLDYSAARSSNGLYVDLSNYEVIKGGTIDSISNSVELGVTGTAQADVFLLSGALAENAVLDGHDGNDTLILNNTGNDNEVNFSSGSIVITPTGGGTSRTIDITNIESVITGGGNDTFIMVQSNSNTALDAGGGNNTADYSGFSVGIIYNAVTSYASYTSSSGTVQDTLANITNIIGSATGSNTFYGTTINQYTFTGGSGNDTIDYSNNAVGVTFDIPNSIVIKGSASDTYSNIENFVGSQRDDIFNVDQGALTGAYSYSGNGGVDTLNFNLTSGTSLNLDFVSGTLTVGGAAINASFLNFSNFVLNNNANDEIVVGGEVSAFASNTIIDAGGGTDRVTVASQGSANTASVVAVTGGLAFTFSTGDVVTVLNAEDFVVNLDSIFLNINDLSSYTPVTFSGTAKTSVLIREINASNADVYDVTVNVANAQSVLSISDTSGSSVLSQNFTKAYEFTISSDVRNYNVVIDEASASLDNAIDFKVAGDLASLSYTNMTSNYNTLNIAFWSNSTGAVTVSRSGATANLTDTYMGAGSNTAFTYDATNLTNATVNISSTALISSITLANLTTAQLQGNSYHLNVSGFVGINVTYNATTSGLDMGLIGSSDVMSTVGFNSYTLTSVSDILNMGASTAISNSFYTTYGYDYTTTTRETFVDAGAGDDALNISGFTNIFREIVLLDEGNFNLIGKSSGITNMSLTYGNFEYVNLTGAASNASIEVFVGDLRDNTVREVNLNGIGSGIYYLAPTEADSTGGFVNFNATYSSADRVYNTFTSTSLGDNISVDGVRRFIVRENVLQTTDTALARDYDMNLTFDFSEYDSSVDNLGVNATYSSIALKGNGDGFYGGAGNGGYNNYHEVTIVGNGVENVYISSNMVGEANSVYDDQFGHDYSNNDAFPGRITDSSVSTSGLMSMWYGNNVSSNNINHAVLGIVGANKMNFVNTDVEIMGAQRWLDGTIAGNQQNVVITGDAQSEVNLYLWSSPGASYSVRISTINGFYLADRATDYAMGTGINVTGFGTYHFTIRGNSGATNVGNQYHVDGLLQQNITIDYSEFTGHSSTYADIYFVDTGTSVTPTPVNITLGLSSQGKKNTDYAPGLITDTRTGIVLDGATSIQKMTAFSDYVNAGDYLTNWTSSVFAGSTNTSVVAAKRGFVIIDENTSASNGNNSDNDKFVATGGVIDLRWDHNGYNSTAHVTKAGYAHSTTSSGGNGIIQVHNFETFAFDGYDSSLTVSLGASQIYSPNNASGNFNVFLVRMSNTDGISTVQGSNHSSAKDLLQIYIQSGGITSFNYLGNSGFSISDTAGGSFVATGLEMIQFVTESGQTQVGDISFNFNMKIDEQSWKAASNSPPADGKSVMMIDGEPNDHESNGLGGSSFPQQKLANVFVNEYLYENVYNQTFHIGTVSDRGLLDIGFTDIDSGERFNFRLWQSNSIVVRKLVIGAAPEENDLSRSYSYVNTQDNNEIMDVFLTTDQIVEIGSVEDTLYELTAQYSSMNGDFDYFRIYATVYEAQHGSIDLLEYIGIEDADMHEFFDYAVVQYEAGVNFYEVDIVNAFYNQDSEGANTYSTASYDEYYTAFQSQRAAYLEEQALAEQEAKEAAKAEAQEQMEQEQAQSEFDASQALADQLEEQALAEQEEKEQAKAEAKEEQEQQMQEEANAENNKEEDSFSLDQDADSFNFAGDDYVSSESLADQDADMVFSDEEASQISQEQDMISLLTQAQDAIASLGSNEQLIQDINLVQDDAHNTEMIINEDNTMSYANDSLIDSSAEVDKTFDSNINGNSNNNNH